MNEQHYRGGDVVKAGTRAEPIEVRMNPRAFLALGSDGMKDDDWQERDQDIRQNERERIAAWLETESHIMDTTSALLEGYGREIEAKCAAQAGKTTREIIERIRAMQ